MDRVCYVFLRLAIFAIVGAEYCREVQMDELVRKTALWENGTYKGSPTPTLEACKLSIMEWCDRLKCKSYDSVSGEFTSHCILLKMMCHSHKHVATPIPAMRSSLV